MQKKIAVLALWSSRASTSQRPGPEPSLLWIYELPSTTAKCGKSDHVVDVS
jgi:hypothetical protein